MHDITFGPGREPLVRDGFQERFWGLFAVEAEAGAALRLAEARGGNVIAATAELDRARAAVEAFLQVHPGREFAVFRPEHVARAFVRTSAPLLPARRPAGGWPDRLSDEGGHAR